MGYVGHEIYEDQHFDLLQEMGIREGTLNGDDIPCKCSSEGKSSRGSAAYRQPCRSPIADHLSLIQNTVF